MSPKESYVKSGNGVKEEQEQMQGHQWGACHTRLDKRTGGCYWDREKVNGFKSNLRGRIKRFWWWFDLGGKGREGKSWRRLRFPADAVGWVVVLLLRWERLERDEGGEVQGGEEKRLGLEFCVHERHVQESYVLEKRLNWSYTVCGNQLWMTTDAISWKRTLGNFNNSKVR